MQVRNTHRLGPRIHCASIFWPEEKSRGRDPEPETSRLLLVDCGIAKGTSVRLLPGALYAGGRITLLRRHEGGKGPNLGQKTRKDRKARKPEEESWSTAIANKTMQRENETTRHKHSGNQVIFLR